MKLIIGNQGEKMLKTKLWKINIEYTWEVWEEMTKEQIISIIKDDVPEQMKEVKVSVSS